MIALWIRLRSLFRRRLDRNLNDEMRFHVEMATQENLRAGMPEAQARAKAVTDFGNRTGITERSREMFTFGGLETLLKDIRYGCRVLAKNPGFSIAAIATLALGIGANVPIFSLVYGVLLRPLPYRTGDRLIVLHQQANRAGVKNFPFSVKEIEDYRADTHTLDSVVEHHSMNFLLLTGEGAERVDTAVVSANFFDVLGVKPLLGRAFVPEDEQHGADAVLILSNEYWRTRFGSDPAIVGRVFQMNNRPHTVIGVLPPIPQYPVENQVYMPTSQCPTRSSEQFISNRTSRMMTAFGRLKPGVTVPQAQADLTVIAKGMEQASPDAYPPSTGYGLEAAPLLKDLTRRAETTFLVLMGTAGLILLIACANVANLSLARLLKVEREISPRLAMGASRMRIVRQLLTESLLLSLAGGALGLALAPAGLQLLVKFAERFTTRAAEVRLDTPVLLFAMAISVVSGILFGLWPAFTSGRSIAEAVKLGGARATESRARQRLRSGLVVTQVTVSFLLLIGARLMIRSFLKLHDVNAGFDSRNLLTMRLSPNFTRYSTRQQSQELSERILTEVRAVRGASVVSMASGFPFNPAGIALGPQTVNFEIQGRVLPPGAPAQIVAVTTVSPDYFTAVGQPVLEGRAFTEHDDANSAAVVVINQAMARRRWPDSNPLGKRVSSNRGQTWGEIVGIVGDVHEYGLDRPAVDKVYVPVKQGGFASNLVIRTVADPMTVAGDIRAALRKVDPQIAVDRVSTVDALKQDSVASRDDDSAVFVCGIGAVDQRVRNRGNVGADGEPAGE